MGVSLATAEFLVQGAARGVSFERTATIGRQDVFAGPARLLLLLRRHGLMPPGGGRAFLQSFVPEPSKLDPLLRALGARELDAIDASAYEGASIVHDLNQPIPDELHERYTTVFDGGSLEHIFDVPTALRSYMQMVEVGGHLIIHTMANNYFGHGFYQFSAEFFYRALSPENGFEVERLVLVEDDIAWRELLGFGVPVERAGSWYEVTDPAEARSRVELQNRRPVVVQVQARRVASPPIFAAVPQQSDYSEMWSESEEAPPSPPALHGWRLALARLFPDELKMSVALDAAPILLSLVNPLRFARVARKRSFRNRRWYRRVR